MPRFLHPYLVCLLACAAIGAFAVIVVNKSVLLRQADLTATQWRDLVATNERTLGALRDAETGQRGYLLTQQADYLEPYQFASRRVPELTRLLESLTRDLPDAANQGATNRGARSTETRRTGGDDIARSKRQHP